MSNAPLITGSPLASAGAQRYSTPACGVASSICACEGSVAITRENRAASAVDSCPVPQPMSHAVPGGERSASTSTSSGG